MKKKPKKYLFYLEKQMDGFVSRLFEVRAENEYLALLELLKLFQVK